MSVGHCIGYSCTKIQTFSAKEILMVKFSITHFFIVEMSICSSNPCAIGGRCYENGLVYSCDCYEFYKGKHCEIGI